MTNLVLVSKFSKTTNTASNLKIKTNKPLIENKFYTFMPNIRYEYYQTQNTSK